MRDIRVFYKKLGRMKFVSHLDMNRFMSRLITKSKIPVWYTEGFNQHLYMNFAIPLSLGFEGLYEIMDIRLTDDNYSLDECLSALKAVCPEDIEFFAVKPLTRKAKEIGFAEFKLSLDEFSEEEKQKLSEFLSRESIHCLKTGKKGKVKEIDIIPKIRSFTLVDDTLTLCLVAGSEDNLNPSLVMSAFFEQTDTNPLYYTVSRTMIFDKDGNIFE